MTRMQGRSAFTLIELLVVIAIMIVILALTAAVAFSGAFDSQKIHSAADRAGGWLVIAKNRAKRDGAPRGVRFLRNPTTLQVTEAHYIEAPEPWAPNADQELNPNGPRIVFAYTQFRQPPPPSGYPAIEFRQVFFVSTSATAAADLAEFDQKVFAGDMLLLPDIGGPHRIVSISPTSPSNAAAVDQRIHVGPAGAGFLLNRNPGNASDNARELILATYPDLGAMHNPTPPGGPVPREATLTTYKFGFQPAPKPLLGEPLLQLTGTTVIDFAAVGQPTTTAGVAMDPAGHFDILFSPSGQVLNNSSGIICLWVRDPLKLNNPNANPRVNQGTGLQDDVFGYDNAGEQLIVAIYTRTGFIATHPLSTVNLGNPALYDPLLTAKDGVNSGF